MPQCAVQYEASGEWRLLHSVIATGKLARLLSLALSALCGTRPPFAGLTTAGNNLLNPQSMWVAVNAGSASFKRVALLVRVAGHRRPQRGSCRRGRRRQPAGRPPSRRISLRRAPGRPPTRRPQLPQLLKPPGQTPRRCRLPRSRLRLSRSAGYVT